MTPQIFTFGNSPFWSIAIIGLALIYFVEVPTRLAGWKGGLRLVALLQCLTGIWLMYCTWAVTVNLALGYKLWI